MRMAALLGLLLLLAGCGSDRSSAPKQARGGLLGMVASSKAPCDRWAASGGDDRAHGTRERPFGSPQVLASALKPGQTGCLRGGAYLAHPGEPYVIRFNHGGRRGQPITIRSAPGQRAELTGIVDVPRGSDDVRIVGVDLHARHIDQRISVGLQVMARRFLLQGSEVTNDGVMTSCVILGSNVGYGPAIAPVLRGNVFHDCGSTSDGLLDHSVYVENAVGGRIVDNVIVRSAGFGVQLYPNARWMTIARNVLYDNGGAVIFGGSPPWASRDNAVRNNAIGGSRSRPEVTASYGGRIGRGNRVFRNCFFPGQAATDSPARGFRAYRNVVVDSTPFVAGLRLRDGTPCRRLVGVDPVADLPGPLLAVAARHR